MKAMLFAAGLGTRLKPFTDNMPKALARVNGKTLLEHNLLYLQRYGIFDIVINVHHFAEQIEEELERSNGFGSRVTISDERSELLETGGGLLKAASYFSGEEAFVVMNTDVLTSLDLGRMIAFHFATEHFATLAVTKRTSGRYFLFDQQMRLRGWKNVKTGEEKISLAAPELEPFAFSGIQVLSEAMLEDVPFRGKFSLVDVYVHQASRHVIRGYEHTGDLFIDVGKPESLLQAESMFGQE